MIHQGLAEDAAPLVKTESEPSALARSAPHSCLLGNSPIIREVNELIERLAGSNLTVLLAGESGTGKDIAARLLHKLSPRHTKPFVKVNCPAIPESILESELFGYERGAFTGARTPKPGRFEIANRGTLFLDEIAETSLAVQGKLLQVLDGEPFLRIGGVRPLHVDVRIIAATNLPLNEVVRQGRMREDIYFRLTEVVIHMPPLREHPEDIPLLAEHFVYHNLVKLGRPQKAIPPDAVAEMKTQRWPGNVRELAARVKKYVATGDINDLTREEGQGITAGTTPLLGAAVTLTSGPESARSAPGSPSASGRHAPERASVDGVSAAGGAGAEGRPFMSLKEATRKAVEDTEQRLIQEALQYTRWNRRRAAKLLGVSYSSLLRRIDAYGLGKSQA